MRRFLISFFCYIFAVVLFFATLGLFGWFFNYGFGKTIAEWAYRLFWVASSAWVLIDNKRLAAWRYRGGLPKEHIVWLVFFVFIGWVIVVPYYLGLRFRIMTKTATLRTEYKPWTYADAKIGPNGLLQPWRGRKI